MSCRARTSRRRSRSRGGLETLMKTGMSKIDMGESSGVKLVATPEILNIS